MYLVNGWKHAKVYQKNSLHKQKNINMWQVDYKIGDALWDCPFELHEGIKCDMLKFWKFQKLYQPLLKLTFNLHCKICQFVQLWESRLKVGFKKLIWKFHSYVAFWEVLGHDLMN